MKSNKELYHKFCEKNPDLSIFMKDWWLDATAGPEHWDAAVVEKGGEVIAVWPYYIQDKILFKLLLTPILTQHLGIWIIYPEGQKYSKRLSYEKDITNELIKRLPKFDRLKQNFHYDFTNWLPLYWNGFKQTCSYSYVIDIHRNIDHIYKNFQQKIRYQINKAKKTLTIEESDDLEIFYKINIKTFDHQKKNIPYTFDKLLNLDTQCRIHNARKMLLAKDKMGNIHAGHYYVWDEKSVYYLMGGSDPHFRSSGATSWLMWEGIKIAQESGKIFDFEGSMIESIERFFRGFGASQRMFFKIEKNKSPLLMMKRAFK